MSVEFHICVSVPLMIEIHQTNYQNLEITNTDNCQGIPNEIIIDFQINIKKKTDTIANSMMHFAKYLKFDSYKTEYAFN